VLPPELTQRLGGPARWSSLRPESLRLGPPEGAALAGRVTALRYLGAGTRVVIDGPGAELAVLVPAGQDLPAPGDRVGLTFDPAMLHVMDEA
jgi:putative spermidine/putrescine transport system ATP-binding protein